MKDFLGSKKLVNHESSLDNMAQRYVKLTDQILLNF